jgi:hypothetical protein
MIRTLEGTNQETKVDKIAAQEVQKEELQSEHFTHTTSNSETKRRHEMR